MKPLYTNTCANCVYNQGGFTCKPHCSKHHIYYSEVFATNKVYCDDFEMQHQKKQRQTEYDRIVNKLIVHSKEEIVNYIANNLDYDSDNEVWIVDFSEEEE